jgi:DNA-binding NtrC family response regulator
MPPSVQVRLLRVLQDGSFERIGGMQSLTADIRVIAATHRDIPRLIQTGQFRQDLYFRLNVFPIHIPPLRQRRADIPALARYFLEQKCRKMNRQPVGDLSQGALEKLSKYDWPGNVRELENIVERSLILHKSGPLTFLPLDRRQPDSFIQVNPSEDSQILPLDAAIAAHIKTALLAARGKVQGPGGAAEILQVNPNTLRKRMTKLDVPFGRKTGLH